MRSHGGAVPSPPPRPPQRSDRGSELARSRLPAPPCASPALGGAGGGGERRPQPDPGGLAPQRGTAWAGAEGRDGSSLFSLSLPSPSNRVAGAVGPPGGKRLLSPRPPRGTEAAAHGRPPPRPFWQGVEGAGRPGPPSPARDPAPRSPPAPGLPRGARGVSGSWPAPRFVVLSLTKVVPSGNEKMGEPGEGRAHGHILLTRLGFTSGLQHLYLSGNNDLSYRCWHLFQSLYESTDPGICFSSWFVSYIA